MKFIDFFAGIGGFRQGLEMAGHTCVGFCEWDKYAAMSYTAMHLLTDEQRKYIESIPAPPKKNGERNLTARQREIVKEKYKNGEWYSNDIRNVDARSVPEADCWCFGAPCQDFSVTGKRAGLDGDRSSLVREVFRILGEMSEENRPEWLLYENVKGMFSSNRGFDYLEILLAMDELGYDIEWQLFNSKDWGVPQNRERVYTVGHLRRYGTRKILPIEGADGENSVSVEQIATRPNPNRENPQAYRVYGQEGIAPCLNTMGGGGREPSVAIPIGNVNPSGRGMNGNVYDSYGLNPALTTNKGEGNKIAVPIAKISDSQDGKVYANDGISQCLSAGNNNQPKVAFPVLTPDRVNKRQNGRRFKEDGEPMFTLTSQDRHGVGVSVYDMYNKSVRDDGLCGTLTSNGNTSTTHCGSFGVMIPVKEATKQGYALAHEGDSINFSIPGSKTRRGRVGVGVGVANTLDTSCNQGIFVQVSDELTVYAIWYEKYQCYIAIRKLTPRECFRLQGWTDLYFERAQLVNSDSQLYKQAGNGVTVNVVYEIGKRIPV